MDTDGASGSFDICIITIKMKRRSLIFWLSYILPIQALDILSFCTLLIPVASGERLSYNVAILLTLFVFFVLVLEQIPPSGDSLPNLSKSEACPQSLVGYPLRQAGLHM